MCFYSCNMSELDVDNININIPREVLTHLFSFLSTSDRKNVRLTCSNWYNACNEKRFLRKEKLVIRTNPVYSDFVIDTLMKCPYKYLNLEFRGMYFKKSSEQFWEYCGSRVYSLAFQKCLSCEETIGKILSSCENLKYLTIERCDDVLSTFELSRFTGNSLIGLKLKFCANITDCTFSKLFGIFPNIKKLSFKSVMINCHKRIDERFYGKHILEDSIAYDSTQIFTFSCIFHKIRSNASAIEKLTFDRIGDHGLTEDWFKAVGSLSNLRLKDLTLKDHNILSENAYKHFFSVQTHLVSLTIVDCLHFTFQCALHVLRNCRNLKHLKIKLSCHRKFIFDQVLYNVLRESSLITFKLIGSFWDSVDVSQINANSDVNNSLRYWSSSIVPLLESFCLSVVETFHNLTFLELNGQETRGGITDTGLQAIFGRLINLTTLKIRTGSRISDYGFTGQVDDSSSATLRGFSIRRLKKLETLSLTLLFECGITHVTFSEFVFPCMRKLSISVKNEILETSFLWMATHIPLLEYLFISSSGISCHSILKWLGIWKNLFALHVCGLSAMECVLGKPVVGYEDLLTCNKSLRYLKLDSPSLLLSRNIFTKQWEEYVFSDPIDENECLFPNSRRK